MNQSKLSIVKIGGEILNNSEMKAGFLEHFSAMNGPRILIHGGGKQATTIASRMGVTTKMIEGRRITDADNLDIAIMVYGGLLNKKLVAELQASGCPACGVSGADGNAILATKRPSEPLDYGFAGDIEQVNPTFLELLLNAELIPVMCALTHDGKGQMLNTNADTIAAETAIAMSPFYETTLYYVFDKPGVLEEVTDLTSVVSELDPVRYRKMVKNKQIADGMIPKLDNGFYAKEHNVSGVQLGNAQMLTDTNQVATKIRL